MTTNQKYFGILNLIFSISFFYYLNSSLHEKSYDFLTLSAVLFGLLIFIAGYILGYKDPIRNSRNNISFQYHLTTFIVVNSVGIPWLFISRGLNTSSLISASLQLFPWAIGLLIHFYFSSKSIKGMDKEEIFD
ncbi:MAG: hypothetical protein JKY42_08990 [Flavobacteriales bacterium]|nr:hypothetical protein [Flavobacteriales bacterium]